MTVEIYIADKIDFRVNERRQYERIKKDIIEKLSKVKPRYCIIVDYVYSNQYDIIIIKNDAIISVELKAYCGEIIGFENGTWHVITNDNKDINIDQDINPYQQARKQRGGLLSYFNENLPKIHPRFIDDKISNITAMICFEKESSFNADQINFRANPWFVITNESDLISDIEQTKSNQFYLKDHEIDALLENMHLQKIDIEKQKEKLDISSRSTLNSEDIAGITNNLAENFSSNYFTLDDLSKIVDAEVATRYLGDAIEKGIIKKGDTGNKFELVDKWYENLPEIKVDEDICSNSDLEIYTKEDFWIRPKKSEEGKEYKGVYRGIKYHFDNKGSIWWRHDKSSPKISAVFSNKKIIDDVLAIKPAGGSFRITEAGEILTKIYFEERGYVSFYIGQFDGEIKFNDIKWKPEGIKKGCIWPSIYDGTTFSVNNNKKLLIHIGDRKVYAIEGHRDLVDKVLHFTSILGGGRFKINENGYILALMYNVPYPEKIEKQLEKLNTEEEKLFYYRKIQGKDGRVPIYVGNFKGNIKFKKIFDYHEPLSEEDKKKFLTEIRGY
jgi:hypothetical protein